MSQERFPPWWEAPAVEMGPLPGAIKPMLPAPGTDPFDSPAHIFEVLWDGLRAIAFFEGAAVRVQDRYLRDITSQYPEFQTVPKRIRGKNVVLDGVIVALDGEGRPDFQRLSHRLGVDDAAKVAHLLEESPVTYQAFDILRWDGRPVISLPLWRRKGLLQQVVRPNNFIKVPDYVEREGLAFFQAARDHGLEGIIAKEKGGLYRPGERSATWLKLPIYQRGEFVIGGYTYGGPGPRRSPGRRGKLKAPFASLLLGLYDGAGQLQPVGEVAGGFDERSAREVLAVLDPLQAKECPFAAPPSLPRLIFWCRPQAVCRVRFGDWSGDGKLRFPIFVALRPDVPPSECRLETLRSP